MSQHELKETLELEALLSKLTAPPLPATVIFFYTHSPVGGAGVFYSGRDDGTFVAELK